MRGWGDYERLLARIQAPEFPERDLNIIVRNCTMKDGHGGGVLGSEISGHVRNVFIEDCVMDSPNLDRGLRFKNNAVRGGILENVFMRNVKIGRVGEAVLTIDLLYEEGAKGKHMPVVCMSRSRT
ncbi:MAG: glycosyl hydrolase family 28 protein [Opitutaceae bacterium]